MAHHEVLVVGGGNAGISLAAKLLRDGVQGVAVMESQRTHRYRPLLNYVGAGEATMKQLERPAAEVMPGDAAWVRDRVVSVDPDGPAARAGILGEGSVAGGDVIVAVDGQPVASMADVDDIVSRHRPGDGVRLVVRG